MEEEPEIEPVHVEIEQRFNGFWPVLLMGVSLLVVLSWEIWIGASTRRGAQQTQDQQVRLVDQSKQVQQNLEKLVRGLVDLAKTDEEAQKLVTRFGIKVNNPSVPATGSAASASPSPSPTPTAPP